MAKTSPGVGSVSELESKFGHIVYPQPTANVPGISQSAIAEAAKNPPGVDASSTTQLLIHEASMLAENPPRALESIENSPGVDCVYCHSPEYESLRDKSYRCYRCQPKTDQNPILTGDSLSDSSLGGFKVGQRAIAQVADNSSSVELTDKLTDADRWNPADFGDVLHKAEASGQLNLLEWDVSEPPDPGDYDLMTDFQAAYDRWLLSSESQEIIHTKNEPTIEGTDTQCERASEVPRNNCVPSECDSGSYRDGAHVDRPHGLEFGKEGDRILAISRNGEGDSGRDLSRKLAELAPIVPPQAASAQAAKKSPGVGVDLKIGMLVGRRSNLRHIGKILNIYQSRRGIWRAKIQPLNKSNFVYFDCAALIEQRLLYDYEMRPGGFVLTGKIFNKARCEHFEVFSRKQKPPALTNWTADELNSLSIFKLNQIARDMQIQSIPGAVGKRSLIRAILAEQAILQERRTAQLEQETGRAIAQKQKSAPPANKKKRAGASSLGNQLSLFEMAV